MGTRRATQGLNALRCSLPRAAPVWWLCCLGFQCPPAPAAATAAWRRRRTAARAARARHPPAAAPAALLRPTAPPPGRAGDATPARARRRRCRCCWPRPRARRARPRRAARADAPAAAGTARARCPRRPTGTPCCQERGARRSEQPRGPEARAAQPSATHGLNVLWATPRAHPYAVMSRPEGVFVYGSLLAPVRVRASLGTSQCSDPWRALSLPSAGGAADAAGPGAASHRGDAAGLRAARAARLSHLSWGRGVRGGRCPRPGAMLHAGLRGRHRLMLRGPDQVLLELTSQERLILDTFEARPPFVLRPSRHRA